MGTRGFAAAKLSFEHRHDEHETCDGHPARDELIPDGAGSRSHLAPCLGDREREERTATTYQMPTILKLDRKSSDEAGREKPASPPPSKYRVTAYVPKTAK